MLVKTFPDSRTNEKIVAGERITLITDSGKKYLDFTSGITAHSILGYSNQSVIKAIQEQATKICHVDYKYFSDEVREELAEILFSRSEHSLDSLYLVGSSGGEACEAALKFSYLRHQAEGNQLKRYVISRAQGYHGSTSDSLSVGDRPNLRVFEPFHPAWREKISEHNYIRHSNAGETPEAYSDRCVGELESKILQLGAENVAAFLGETTMGGLVGDVEPHPGYWSGIREVCDRYNVHLILDEVWCGTGTSGKIYSIDWDGVSPDFIFIGKTLGAGYGAVSALILSSETVKVIKSHYSSIPHSITHQGHTLACAAALAAQRIIHNDEILSNVLMRGAQFKSFINKELKACEYFVEVRGRGLRISIEYCTPDNHWFGTTVAGILRDEYGILISGKWHRLSISPALIIDEKEIRLVASAIVAVFLDVSNNFESYKRKYLFEDSVF